MKVLHLNTTNYGGAYRAASRIHEAVSRAGVDSNMLFVQGSSEKDSIAWRWKDKIRHKIYCRLNNQKIKNNDFRQYYSTDIYGFDIERIREVREADILHFHWISDGMFSMKSLGRLFKTGKPVVWTMHDMCAFTGGCHHSEKCRKYEGMCSDCPYVNVGGVRDITNIVFRKKREIYRNNHIFPVGPSRWISELSKRSCLFGEFDTIAIPNPIDISAFDIIGNRNMARELLNLPKEKKIILFGANNAMSDPNKGYKELRRALQELNHDDYICVVFGNSTLMEKENDIKIISVGVINDDFHLKCLYNAADVFVCPSLYENLANTVMESLSCGTPVVAFDTGGLKDMIEHRENGYLAVPYDTGELAEGIVYCASNDLRNKARKSVENRFSYDIIGKQYIELYNKALYSK